MILTRTILAFVVIIGLNAALALVLAIAAKQSRDEEYEQWLALRVPAKERRG